MEARPDPIASVAFTNEGLSRYTLGATPDANLTLSWMQDLPYPGKRRLAGDVARADAEIVRSGVETIRLRIRAEIESAYAELWRIDRTAEILADGRRLLDSLVETARARYEVGGGALENVLKAQTERAILDVEIEALRRERRGVEAELRAAAGRADDDRSLGAAAALPAGARVDGAALEAAAIERSPELLELRATTRRDETRLASAELGVKPDFVWGAWYMNRGGLDPMVGGSFGLKLPLARRARQEQAIAQSDLELQASRRDVAGREARIRGEVRRLVARADEARTRKLLYRDSVLPLVRTTLDAATAAYASGRVEFVALLDDFRALLDGEREHAAQAAAEIRALAALEPLTAASLVLTDGASGPALARGGFDE